MIRIYCSKCRYLESNFQALGRSECIHPTVRSTSMSRDWYNEIEIVANGDPKELNRNNDCQLYERKE